MKISPSPGRIGPSTLSRYLFSLLLSMTYGSPAFIQDGVLPALERELPHVTAMREAYRDRARLLSCILADAPRCRVTPPEGGMFVLLDVRGTGLSSAEFAQALLEHSVRNGTAEAQSPQESTEVTKDVRAGRATPVSGSFE